MAGGIFEQVAEHFSEVAAVERHADVIGNVRLERDPHTDRCPGKRRNEQVHERRKSGGETCTAPEAPTHAGPRQLAIDVAPHCLADGLDTLRDGVLAMFAQASRISSEGRKRRLESMGQIRCLAAGALDLALLGIKQCVDLLDERPNLDRHRRRQMTAAPCPDVGDAAAQQIQRPQAEADLHRGGDSKDESEQRERKREVLREGGGGRRHPREIGGHGHAHRHAPIADHEAESPFRDKHARPARPLHGVPVNLTRRGLIDWQRHRRVPQRA